MLEHNENSGSSVDLVKIKLYLIKQITPPTHHRRISYLISLKSGQRVGRQSVDSRPSVGRLSADCRPTRWPTCLPTRRLDRFLYHYRSVKGRIFVDLLQIKDKFHC